MPRPPSLLLYKNLLGGLTLFLAIAPACVEAPPPETTSSAAVVVDSCSGVADGALCNDQNTCTYGDQCRSGVCVGTVAVDGTTCTDGNQCTKNDLCDRGVCVGMVVPDGTMCTDGDPCTGPDLCMQARCHPGPVIVCTDGGGEAADSGPGSDATQTDDGSTDQGGAAGEGGAGGAGGEGGAGGGPGDAAVDAVDGGDAAATLYAVRGGACVCGVADAPSSPATFLGAVLVTALLLVRRRHRRS